MIAVKIGPVTAAFSARSRTRGTAPSPVPGPFRGSQKGVEPHYPQNNDPYSPDTETCFSSAHCMARSWNRDNAAPLSPGQKLRVRAPGLEGCPQQPTPMGL